MLRPTFTGITTKIETLPQLIALLNQKLPPLAAAVVQLVDVFNSFATPKAVAAAFVATLSEGFIRADATAGAFVITLPAAALVPGKKYTIKKVDVSGNAVTIDANAAELIDGALTKVLAAAYATATIQSNGVSWDVL